jgi:hypothetical protein
MNIFLLFYSLGMIPALWLQHEITVSFFQKNLINESGNLNLNAKFSTVESFEGTTNFELLLFGTLLIVRILIPRENNWNLKCTLDLVMHDVIYMTDSLDFSKILFDSVNKSMDQTFKILVLLNLAYTSSFYCLNTVYRPNKIHVSKVKNGELSKLDVIELRLSYDPFIRFLVPNIFFEIPMIIFRTYLFYGLFKNFSKTIEWKNLSFLLKNIVSIFVTFLAYLEIRKIKVDDVFYNNHNFV